MENLEVWKIWKYGRFGIQSFDKVEKIREIQPLFCSPLKEKQRMQTFSF